MERSRPQMNFFLRMESFSQYGPSVVQHSSPSVITAALYAQNQSAATAAGCYTVQSVRWKPPLYYTQHIHQENITSTGLNTIYDCKKYLHRAAMKHTHVGVGVLLVNNSVQQQSDL